VWRVILKNINLIDMLNEMGYLNAGQSRFLSGKKLFVVLLMLTAMNASGQWNQSEDVLTCGYAFALKGDTIFTGTLYFGVYLSTNNGSNWTQTSLSDITVYSLATFGNNILAGMGYGNNVYRSTNNGINWTEHYFSYYPNVYALAVLGNNIFAGTSYGIYISTNNGLNWAPTVLNIANTRSLIISNNNIIAGTMSGIYISSNNGSNWNQTSLNNKIVLSLAVDGNNIYAGTGTSGSIGVYLSTNNGVNWNQIGLSNRTVYSLAISGNNIFAGTDYGVYHSTNNGANWTIKNEGFFVQTEVYSLMIKNNYIFAGSSQGIWRRNISEVITNNQQISEIIPSSYSLSQNYPNPFNSMCNVQFSMCNTGNVKLVVYDVMGREVQTLVNERLQAGTYEVSFDGSKLNSGVYFYKLTTEGFSETKRMLMIK
jgi:hypothetical protein